jgi:hypothetical protein
VPLPSAVGCRPPKGFGLAFFIEVLTGILSSGAIDASRFGGAQPVTGRCSRGLSGIETLYYLTHCTRERHLRRVRTTRPAQEDCARGAPPGCSSRVDR